MKEIFFWRYCRQEAVVYLVLPTDMDAILLCGAFFLLMTNWGARQMVKNRHTLQQIKLAYLGIILPIIDIVGRDNGQ